jgi:hypothetical protein
LSLNFPLELLFGLFVLKFDTATLFFRFRFEALLLATAKPLFFALLHLLSLLVLLPLFL